MFVFARLCLLAGLLGLLTTACRPPFLGPEAPALPPGPVLLVLGDSLPGRAPLALLPPDSLRPALPALHLYAQAGWAEAGTPLLRSVARLPTAPWQVEFDVAGQLRGQPLRYVRAQHLGPELINYPPLAPVPAPRWSGFLVATEYPQLPPGMGPAGANAALRAHYDRRDMLSLQLPDDSAYYRLDRLQRRRLTDTVVLFRQRIVALALLRPPGAPELLSVTVRTEGCGARRYYDQPTCEGLTGSEIVAALYLNGILHEGLPRDYYVGEASYQLFDPALGRRLATAALEVVRWRRHQHGVMPLTDYQQRLFRRQFEPFAQARFTRLGLLIHYCPPFGAGTSDALSSVLPPPDRQLALLVPYRVLGHYAPARPASAR